jgi:hypothetical protein
MTDHEPETENHSAIGDLLPNGFGGGLSGEVQPARLDVSLMSNDPQRISLSDSGWAGGQVGKGQGIIGIRMVVGARGVGQ